MGIFRQFPYTNFHEFNLDEIIKIMRQMQDEWEATKAEWASYKDFIDNYFENLDVSEEVLAALRIMAGTGELNTIMDPVIATETSEWLALHITQPTTPAIDNTLTVQGAAADAKATGDAIDHLETEIEPFFNKYSFEGMFIQGGLNISNGHNTVATNRIRSSLGMDLSSYERIETSATYKMLLLAYATDKTESYIGYWNGTDFSNPIATPYWSNSIPIINKEYLYRIVLAYNDDSDLTPTDSNVIKYVTRADGLLRNWNKAADAQITGNRLSYIYESAIEKLPIIPRTVYTNSIESKMVTGAIDPTGTNTNSETYLKSSFRSEYFEPVRDADCVEVSYDLGDSDVNYYAYVFFYNWDGVFISRIGGKLKYILADVPPTAAYYKISLTQVTNALYGTNNVLNLLIRSGYNKSSKKKMYVFGDSISAGYYSLQQSDVPTGITPAITYPDGTCAIWDKDLIHNYWSIMNKKYLHYDQINLAYPGQGFIRKASNRKNAIDVIQDNNITDADLIVIAYGFNDWHYNQQRGDHTLIDPSTPIPDNSFDTTTITTINQAIWYCLGNLAYNNPDSLIAVQTPLNGWRYGGDFSTKWSINYTMSNSGTLKDIHDDIIYWCDFFGLKYIDLTFNNEIVNLVNIEDTLLDGSHPTAKTHEQLADTVWKMI